MTIKCPVEGCKKEMIMDEMAIGSHLRSHVNKGDIGPKKAQRLRHKIIQADISGIGRKDNRSLEKQLTNDTGIK